VSQFLTYDDKFFMFVNVCWTNMFKVECVFFINGFTIFLFANLTQFFFSHVLNMIMHLTSSKIGIRDELNNWKMHYKDAFE
jgi:hypothetical protein